MRIGPFMFEGACAHGARNGGEPITEVGDRATARIEAPQRRFGSAKVTFSDCRNDRVFRIEESVEDKTGKILARCAFPARGLRHRQQRQTTRGSICVFYLP
jgi:hypothetical protein